MAVPGRADAVVVGGGIAGLAVAYHLAHAHDRSVVLLEREPLLATHSSARNAAIFRPLEERPGIAELALRSRAIQDALLGRDGWLRQADGLFVAPRRAALDALAEAARTLGLAHARLTPDEVTKRAPSLGPSWWGLVATDSGVIDIHALTARLGEAAAAAGATIVTGCEVRGVRTAGGRVEAVDLTGGGAIVTESVVIAGGAWAATVGDSAGAPLPLVPLRRHLVHLDTGTPLAADAPIVWRVDEQEVYFRAESGGVLASACDEEPWPPCLPPADPAIVERLATRLTRVAPGLASAAATRVWACLRTFAPDRRPVAGADPRVRGLFWLAGLGGSGMTIGTAAGEVTAALVRGEAHPLAAALAPERFLAAPATIAADRSAVK